jgi:hypothetical protein
MSTVFDLVLGAFREPGLVAELRDKQLPDELAQVIRLAAGEDAALQGAVDATGEIAETLVEASVFFLQQVLFAPGADSYRVLGAAADSSQERLRENYRWLMKWLHPDRNQDGWEAVYADRVNVAWQDLKTPDRRAEYDSRIPAASALAPMSTGLVRRSAPVNHAPAGQLLSGSMVRRLPTLVLGTLGIVAAATIAIMYWAQTETARELSERRRDRAEPVAVDASVGLQDAAPAVASVGLPPDTAPVDAGIGLPVVAVADVAVSGDSQPVPVAAAIEPTAAIGVDAVAAAPEDMTGEAPVADGLADDPAVAIAEVVPISAPAIESVNATSPQQVVVPVSPPTASAVTPPVAAGPEPTLADAEVADSMPAEPVPRVPSPPRTRSIPTAVSEVAKARETAPAEAVDMSASPVAATRAAADAKPVPASPAPPVPTRPAAASKRPPSTPAPVAVAVAAPAQLAPTPAARPGADGRGPAAPASTVIVDATTPVSATEAVGVDPEPAAAPTADSTPAPAPARSDAEALVREFASAYASGDLARFNRLFSSASAVGGALDPMRSRFKSTEMRYLEIQQLRWHSEAAHGYVRARFRDTYVPRGGRKAVTESGEIEWTIRVDAGDARIASVARNDVRP